MILEAKRLSKQKGTRIIVLTPKQILQRLAIALAQIKAGNNSKKVLNEIRSSVKWGHFARNGVGLFQICNHVKTFKNH